jgi:histidyl-tRNA synthetase
MVALGFERFSVRVNNRMVLNGLLAELGLAEKTGDVLRALDKLAKAGRDAVLGEMTEKGAGAAQAEQVLALAETRGTNGEILDRLERDFGGNEQAKEGIARLRQLVGAVQTAGMPEERVQIDVSIARGLDYYTGTIYETFLTDKPDIGSVCSGGRYDNLAELYTSQKLPGVGASLGLDRLLAAMEELNMLGAASTPAPVIIFQFSAENIGDYQRMARLIRAAGVGVEVYADAKKLGPQFQYAEKRGFRVGLIAGPDEFARGEWKIKDLARREEISVPEAEVMVTVRTILSTSAG